MFGKLRTIAMARKGTAHIRLRWPDILHKRIAEEAAKTGRSLNAEILWRIGLTLEPEWQDFIAARVEEEAEREKRDRETREKVERMMQDPKQRENIARIIAKMEPKAKYQKKS
jgi:hypothetical protein